MSYGVYKAEVAENNNISLCQVRKPNRNKGVTIESLLNLLWKAEISLFLQSKGVHGLTKKNKQGLCDLIINNYSLNIVREYVCKTLKIREFWRT